MVGGSSHFVSGSSPAVLMVLFEAQYDTPDEIIKKHSEATEKEFKIKLTDEEEKLPHADVLDTETSQKALQSQIHCWFKFLYYH